MIIKSTVLLLVITFSQVFGEDQLEADLLESRYTFETPEERVKKIQATFTINQDLVDSFGLYQEEVEKKEVNLSSLQESPEKIHESQIPFQKIIDAIPITVVMPEKRMILSGNRPIRLGDVIPINYQNQKSTFKLSSFGRGKIIFEHVSSGKKIVRDLDHIPKGMTKKKRTLRDVKGFYTNAQKQNQEMIIQPKVTDVTNQR